MTLTVLFQLRRLGGIAMRQVIGIVDLAAFVLLVPIVTFISLAFAVRNLHRRLIRILSIFLGALSIYLFFFL